MVQATEVGQRVSEAEVGEHPRRRRRERDVSDQADHVRQQDRVAEAHESVVAAEVDEHQRQADDRELGVPVGPRHERGQKLRAVHDPLQRQLEERVGVALDPDYVEPVVEGFRWIAVGDPARGLVHGQETEPDGKLAREVRPTPGQETMAGSYEDTHGTC